ncbi:MAG: adenylylsulfate kinase [Lachnospiraceae bacterium]|nr:adenylylsulfate kinase [Lachnospiraceae bacterium]
MLLEKLNLIKDWKAPSIPSDIPHGDMPGDKVEINDGHVMKANVIFPRLLELMKEEAGKGKEKIVITVCGGSGVGKSEIASILSFYLTSAGIKSYTLSGDNYPRRIPMHNDAERLRVYEEEGRAGLEAYLGSDKEINFKEIEKIALDFKEGVSPISLRRLGRKEDELWYDDVDFSDTDVLIIEWTHGNSDNYKGVDIPILLNSTPKETLEHRRSRNRDGATDSPFTTMVLEIEQGQIKSQAHKAKIIISKQGELLSFDEYQKLMEAEK